MIASLRGTVTYTTDKYLIIEVAGVGYQLFVPDAELGIAAVGHEAFFWTFQVVREQALDLYGFADLAAVGFFESLTNVSGIGPRSLWRL